MQPRRLAIANPATNSDLVKGAFGYIKNINFSFTVINRNTEIEIMNKTAAAQPAKITNSLLSVQGLLQRNCACGNHTVTGGECAECAKKKTGLQRKLAIGASNDPLEYEADRIAEQVMSTPLNSAINSTPLRIQRFSRQANEWTKTAPASVERVLADSGRPLEPTLQQDMEQRFGHDFSGVRVHTSGGAEQSARDVNAHAYTAGNNIVFAAGRFAPQTNEGQRLLAHELAHVLQQQPSNRVEPKIMCYRDKASFRFNKSPPGSSAALVEQTFTDKTKQPWLKKITVNFTSSKPGSNNDTIPIGKLTGEYEKNSGKLPDIKLTVTGGSSRIGFTNSGNFKVKRIEGAGYNQLTEKGGVGPKKHYDKDIAGGSMSYAIFFFDKQALHAGSLTEGSHSCVHVDWNTIDHIRQINYHSVIGLTEVEINYSPTLLKKICCDRRKHQRIKESDVLNNPCNNVSGKACKSGAGGKKTSAVCVPSNFNLVTSQNGEMEGNETSDYSNQDSNTNIRHSDLVGLKNNDGLNWGTWHTRPRVHKLQDKLTEKGFFAKSDGMFGPKTLQALHQFQASRILPILDFVDEVTATSLEQSGTQSCPPGFTPMPLDSDDMV